MNRPTIYDVARTTGFATSTVSRAFSDPDRVAAATRRDILSAAEHLGYRPAARRRPVRGGRRQVLATVVPDVTNPFYFEVLRGAELAARDRDYALVLVNAAESPQLERDQVDRLAGSVDGLLLLASRLPDQLVVGLAARLPLVLVNRELDGVASVSMDQADGCRQVAAHLAALGHEQLVFLAGPPNSWTAGARRAGLARAAREAGLRFRSSAPHVPTARAGADAAADVLGPPGTTAVVAHNDLLALGLMHRLVERGVQVPSDLSVVGFDDIFAASICRPQLTSVGGPHALLGRLAVESLLAAVGQRPDPGGPSARRLQPQLVVRGSTGPPRGVRRAAVS